MIKIYTDGAYSINRNIGGWAFIILNGDDTIQGFGSKHDTTNNKMEIKALLESLRTLNINFNDKTLKIDIFSDSQYVINSASSWIKNWVKNNFKGKKNKDMWLEYLELSKGRDISYTWIKGHSGDYYNELCDQLASDAVENHAKK